MSLGSDRLLRCLVRTDVDVVQAPLRPEIARAEELILSGNFAGALAALSSAVGAQNAFLVGAARLALGDAAGAERACARAGGEPVLQAALRALVSARKGSFERAESELARASRLAPRRAWPWVLAASVRESRRDFSGADHALGQAVRREPRGWIHAERARVREILGCLPDAIASARAAIALDPTAAHHRLKGELQERWREHVGAAAEFARALRLSPADAGLSFLRARVLSAAGRFDEARAAAEETERLAPDDAGFRAWRLQLDIVAGEYRRAEREIARLLRARSTGDALRVSLLFLRGYLAMRRRRWSEARGEFDALWRPGDSTAFSRKMSFYSVVCRSLQDGGPDLVDASLVLAGLGVDPPYTATAESLRAIASADTVFNNVMGDEMFEFLRSLCPDVRAVAYHQCNDESRLADRMMVAARPGRKVVFVTRGSAIVYGPLGSMLLRRCLRRSISCRTLTAVSSMESIHARLAWDGSLQRGSAVIDSGHLEPKTTIDPRVALTAYMSFDRGDVLYARFCATAARSHGPKNLCAVFDHVIGQEPLSWTIADLSRRRDRLSVSAIVHFSPRAGQFIGGQDD